MMLIHSIVIFSFAIITLAAPLGSSPANLDTDTGDAFSRRFYQEVKDVVPNTPAPAPASSAASSANLQDPEPVSADDSRTTIVATTASESEPIALPVSEPPTGSRRMNLKRSESIFSRILPRFTQHEVNVQKWKNRQDFHNTRVVKWQWTWANYKAGTPLVHGQTPGTGGGHHIKSFWGCDRGGCWNGR